METIDYYIREQIHTQFIPKKVHGLVYLFYANIDGHIYPTASKTKTTDFLFGPVLNMYISGNELLPIPKSTLKANRLFMPEILNTKSEVNRYLNKAIENMEILWKKYQNPKKNKDGLDKLAHKILLANDQFLDQSLAVLSTTKTIEDPKTKQVYPVFNVHLTLSEGDNSEFRRDITLSNGAERLHLSKQMFDTGAKIPLIMPSLVQKLNLTPIKKVVLSGIGEEHFLTDAVSVKIGIEGKEYESLAAIFPRLRSITNSDVLIDCQLYNKTLADGVDYRIKH